MVAGYLAATGEGLVADGRPPYVLTPGGSNARSSVGYLNAVLEMARQLREAGQPDLAALLAAAGVRLAGRARLAPAPHRKTRRRSPRGSPRPPPVARWFS